MFGFLTETIRRTVYRMLAGLAIAVAVRFALAPLTPKFVADNVGMVVALAALSLQIEPRGPTVTREEWMRRAALATLSGIVVTVAFRLLDALPRLIAFLWR